MSFAVKSPKRPVAVTVVGTITVLTAVLSLLVVVSALGPNGLWVAAQTEPLIAGLQLTETGELMASAALLFISGSVTLALGIGLFRTRRWAWEGLMAWTGFNLALNLVRYWYRQPAYIALLFGVIVVFSLNLAEVQEAFGIRKRKDGNLESSD